LVLGLFLPQWEVVQTMTTTWVVSGARVFPALYAMKHQMTVVYLFPPRYKKRSIAFPKKLSKAQGVSRFSTEQTRVLT